MGNATTSCRLFVRPLSSTQEEDYTQTSFGRDSTVTAKVTVGAQQQPVPTRLAPIGFVGLRVEARANKAGGFVEVWSAEALIDTGKSATKQSGPSTSAASSSAAA